MGPPCSSWGDGRSEARTWADATRQGLGCARAPTLRPVPPAPPALQPPGTPSNSGSRKSRQENSLLFPVARLAASSSEQIQEGPLLSLLSWLRRVSVSSSCEEPGLPSRGGASSVEPSLHVPRRQRLPLPGSGAPAQGLWRTRFSALRHVGPSQSRITPVPCAGRGRSTPGPPWKPPEAVSN